MERINPDWTIAERNRDDRTDFIKYELPRRRFCDGCGNLLPAGSKSNIHDSTCLVNETSAAEFFGFIY